MSLSTFSSIAITTQPETAAIKFYLSSSSPVITIKPDGSVILAEGVTLDVASQLFWDTVNRTGVDMRSQLAKLEAENANLRATLSAQSSNT